MSIYRPEFEAGLRLLAQVSEAMANCGLSRPVLVGGAAVEIYSNSAIMTGDYDIVVAGQQGFEDVLIAHGFIRPSGPGKATRGWIHPELQLGFEAVGATLLDGNADRDRIMELDLGADGKILVIGVEDMIADRMGQYASGSAPEMREQAEKLFKLYKDADLHYMETRIRQETAGDYGVEDIKG